MEMFLDFGAEIVEAQYGWDWSFLEDKITVKLEIKSGDGVSQGVM